MFEISHDEGKPVFNWPIYLLQEGVKYPERGNYFIVAGNGIFVHKDTGAAVSLVPVERISFLPDLKVTPFISWNVPKLPADLVHQIKIFFAIVYQKYQSEAVVDLYYNFAEKQWKVDVSKQYVNRGGIAYEVVGTSAFSNPETIQKALQTGVNDLQKWIKIGTIHSHCDFNAFHSMTDVEDEMDFDGLHCTFGHVNRDEFSISASLVNNGFRQKVNPVVVLDGIESTDAGYRFIKPEVSDSDLEAWFPIIDEWLNNVTPAPKPFVTESITSNFLDEDDSFTLRDDELDSEGIYDEYNYDKIQDAIEWDDDEEWDEWWEDETEDDEI